MKTLFLWRGSYFRDLLSSIRKSRKKLPCHSRITLLINGRTIRIKSAFLKTSISGASLRFQEKGLEDEVLPVCANTFFA